MPAPLDPGQTIRIGGATQSTGPDIFREQMERWFSVGLAVSSLNQPFQTQLTGYCGRRLRFAALRFSPHSTSSGHMGQRACRLLISLQKEGVALVQQDGRECRVEPGDMFMIDPSRPFAIETGEILTHSVYLEPDSLRSVLPEYEHLTARAVRCTSGPGALYRGLIDQLFPLATVLDESTADRIADALPGVLAAALSGVNRDAALPPSRLRQMHKQRILRFARENLRDRKLNAQAVAQAVQLSTRYLYELFDDEEQPLMKWIWNTRLDRCRADLGTPALASRSIAEIAFYWGFNDGAHFSRAFRQRFGQSPRAYRTAASPAASPAARRNPPDRGTLVMLRPQAAPQPAQLRWA